MSKIQLFKLFLTERLTAAAVEIFGAVEKTVAEYEEEVYRSKEENERLQGLLDLLHKTDFHQLTLPVSEEEVPPEHHDLGQEDLEPTWITEDQELRTNQGGGQQLQWLESDTKASLFTPHGVKSDCDENPPQPSHLYQNQTVENSESNSPPTICVPVEIKTEGDGEGYRLPQLTCDSQFLPAVNPDFSATQSEDSEGVDVVESGGLPARSMLPKSRRTQINQAQGRTSSSVSARARKTSELRVPFWSHPRERPYKCPICWKYFNTAFDLRTHKRYHTDENPFKCQECGKCFNSQDNLSDHMRTHMGETPYQCKDCGKCFTVRARLIIHMRIHTGEKPYKCPVCRKGFTTSCTLQRHEKIHSEEKQYDCQECGKCFKRKDNLMNHMRTHTGEKPHQCKICSKCFTQKGSMTDHMRIHTGEKPYKCILCGYSFTSASDLRRHQRVHTGAKPYWCNDCSKCFRWSGDLKRHMRNVHNRGEDMAVTTEENVSL